MNIVCLTETQQTEDKYARAQNLKVFSSMREHIQKNKRNVNKEYEKDELKTKKEVV